MPRTSATQAKIKKTTKKSEDKVVVEIPDSKTISTSQKLSFKKVKSKKLFIILGLIGLGVLLYLASRFLVVAWVDNQPVTKFELYSELEKRYGKDTLEQMIVEKLILSEASKKGITASSNEIDEQIKKIEESQGGADQLNQILQAQGINRTELRNLVKLQVIREKLFNNNITISDEDVNKYIEDNKSQLPEVTDQVKQNIKEQLKQQKVNENFQNWLKDNLQSSRVKRV